MAGGGFGESGLRSVWRRRVHIARRNWGPWPKEEGPFRATRQKLTIFSEIGS
jgi:hypothetical protein